MERSIPQATPGDGLRDLPPEGGLTLDRTQLRLGPWQWALALVSLCLVVFIFSHPDRPNFYVHFVWQAQAWLDGQTSIPIHVQGTATSPGNDWYQDVMPILNSSGQDTGRGIVPFPPLPALLLAPFVAIWGLRTNEQLLATVFGALDVGIAYWMLGYLNVRPAIRGLTALFLGLGTALWYSAAIGTTWFWAHIVAVLCLLGAVGLALSADREAALPVRLRSSLPAAWPGRAVVLLLGGAALLLAGLYALSRLVVSRGGATQAQVTGAEAAVLAGGAILAGVVLVALFASSGAGRASRGLLGSAFGGPEARQVGAGFLFGLAVAARLTIVFGFPFFMLVGGGRSWLRRTLWAGLGAAIPIAGLLLYTYASTSPLPGGGQLFNPAYDYLYRLELGYTFLNYHANWSIEDLRYVPQNLSIMLFSLPHVLPRLLPESQTAVCAAGQARGLFDRSCPLAIPDQVGMSLLLTSPAYLLAPFAFAPALWGRVRELDRATVGASIAVLAIAFVNLMHFSQGWVQFGYRFSNDFVPFALILVALGAARLGRLWPLVLLVGASIAINAWGVAWGAALGW